jgi:2-keto-4-pentenoate hydratase/2-oxohepta-3-ene-1,7-dioic acid hydratase in catechol pathway
MKLARVSYMGKIYYGHIQGNMLIAMGDGYCPSSFKMEIPLGEAKILVPTIPTKIIAVGLNYLDHIKEMKHEMPLSPVVFNKFPQCVIGPDDKIRIPDGTDFVDYEGELAVVISKEGFRIGKKDAQGYVLGATCLNDVTYRKMQKLDGQWTRAKNYPTFCPIGPVIDTEVDYDNADIELKLNGIIKQKSNTGNFLWNVGELIEFISGFTVLYPGDVISTGTTSGIGPMYSGDKAEITIKGVGTLVNYVK